MAINKEADFIMKDGRAIYPPVISDESLKLWYDTKGKKNSDRHKDKMFDMSGNKNHGTLENFDYKNLSGYQEDSELVFDGINDTLKMPELSGIDSNNFTYQLNNNILAFTGSEVKTVKNGDIEVGGRNLLPDTSSSWKKISVGTNASPNIVSPTNIEDYGLEIGDYIVIGMDLYSKNPGEKIRTRITSYDSEGGSKNIIRGNQIEDEKGRSVLYFQITEKIHRFEIRIQNARDDKTTFEAEYRKLKVEKGNKATDWTPAPEDLLETTELKGNILGDMEDIIDDHTRDEQSGVEVFTDKADDSLVRVEVDGKSYQHAGSGKNLFTPNTDGWAKDNKGAFTSQNGEYTYRRESGGNYDRIYRTFNLKPDTKYTFSYNYTQGNGLSLEVFDSTFRGELLELHNNWTYGSGSVVFTTKSENAVLSFRGNGATSWFTFIKPQLEEGSTATPYEPPAPTPDYPIEINSLNDFDVVSQKSEGGGRNLIEDSKNLIIVQGEETTHNGVSCYKVASNTGTNYTKIISLSEDTVKDKSYTFSVMVAYEGAKPDRIELYLDGLVAYTKVQGFEDLIEGKFGRVYVTVPNATGGSPRNPRPHFHIRGGDGYVYLANWKLEKGNKATDWTPAPEDIKESNNHPLIDKINLSLSEPLRSVGDVKDRLFRDSDGVWKIERNVGEKELNGTAGWSTDGYRDKGYNYAYFRPANFKTSGKVRSNILPYGISTDNTRETLGRTSVIVFNLRDSRSGVSSSDSGSQRVSKIRDYLFSIEGAMVSYELATPTTETLDQELQDKLNNLRSFQDSNYVYTVINEADDLPSHISENLKPIIDTEFLAHDHYKENRTVNNLLIWNRSLEDDELLNQNKLFHERFNMKSNTVKGEPINQEINLLQGGYVANTLSLEYTIEI